MRNYRDLQVWSKAHNLTLDLYRVSRDFPREEIYGVTSQLRRAAVSIGANSAEGCGRRSSNELARFARVAMGSASELDFHLLLCRDLGFMKDDEFDRAAKRADRRSENAYVILEHCEGTNRAQGEGGWNSVNASCEFTKY